MAFPNISNKTEFSSVFNPSQALAYRKRQEGKPNFSIPKGCILCYNWKLLDHILKNSQAKPVDGFISKSYLLEDTDNQILVVSKFGIGAPVVVALLEELIAYGIKYFISIGNAGAISKKLNDGDVVVCEKAIRDEGTSYHYLPKSKFAFATKEITTLIKKKLTENKIPFYSGASWTNDSFYRQTINEVIQYQKEGILTVEMEASALFAVAKFRGVQMGSILTISDSIANLKWNPQFHSKKVHTAYDVLFKTAKDTLLMI